MYCPKCGKELLEDAKFCTSCGAATTQATSYRTATERIGTDRSLQNHWIERIVAILIDSVIVGVATTILLIALFFPILLASPVGLFNWWSFPFAMGIIYILYFTVAEATYGKTIGKAMLGLRVVTVEKNQRVSFERALIRNLSKIHWVLLILDVIGGFLIATDPHQKYSDRVARTTVV